MKFLALAISCLCVSLPAHAIGVSGQGTWETTLQGRDLDGNLTTAEAYYDTVLGITWLADGNYAQTSGDDSDGRMAWAIANAWVENLDFGGINGWRLPAVSSNYGTVADNSTLGYDGSKDYGYNVSAPNSLYAGSFASEMAHMYYNTLGAESPCDPTTSTVTICGNPQASSGLSNAGPFSNIQSFDYWSSKDFTPYDSYAWIFTFYDGFQGGGDKASYYYAWAVHDSDIGTALLTSAVPLPASVWLFGSGLLGLVGMSRMRKAI